MTARKFNRRAQSFKVADHKIGQDASVRQLDVILRGLRNPAMKGTKLENEIVEMLDTNMKFEQADNYIKRIAKVIAKRQSVPAIVATAVEHVESTPKVLTHEELSKLLGVVAGRNAIKHGVRVYVA